MLFVNKSQRLATLFLPSQTIYSTVLVDSFDQLESQSYEKVLLVSEQSIQKDLSGFLWKLCVGQENLFVHLYEQPHLSCDTTFVIQGPLHEHTPYTVLYTAPYGAISLGLWEDDFPAVKAHVETKMIDNYYNKYFQIVSTLKGLLHVKTPYAIKVRADEYFVNFLPFLTKLKSLQPQQILTSNIFFKKANDWPYHISDHIMGGKTEYILNMFIKAHQTAEHNTLYKITPEVHLAISYLQHFGDPHPEDRDIQKIIRYMYTFFDIFPVRHFEDYTMKGPSFSKKADGLLANVNTLEAMSDFQVIRQ
jgi:hypothetical protein